MIGVKTPWRCSRHQVSRALLEYRCLLSAPVAFHPDPTASGFFPAPWNPAVIRRPRRPYPLAGYPNIAPAIPSIVTGLPDVAWTRLRGGDLATRRRWTHSRSDLGICGTDCKRQAEQCGGEKFVRHCMFFLRFRPSERHVIIGDAHAFVLIAPRRCTRSRPFTPAGRPSTRSRLRSSLKPGTALASAP